MLDIVFYKKYKYCIKKRTLVKMEKIFLISIAIFFTLSCSKKIIQSSKVESTTQNSVKSPSEKPIESDILSVPSEKSKEIITEVPKESTIVAKGKETYKAKCGKCHNLKEPEEYNTLRWVKIIDWMAPKAKLDASEKQNVLAYVSFYAKSGS
jgi:DNA-directed RNA polymerase subunit M/transcription elongation factor TFIIS